MEAHIPVSGEQTAPPRMQEAFAAFPRAVSSPGWLLATPRLPSEVTRTPCWHGPPSSLLRASPAQGPSGTPRPETGSPLIFFFSSNALLFLFTDPSTIYNYLMSCTVTAGPRPIPHPSGEAPGLFLHQLKSTLVGRCSLYLWPT